APPETSIAIVWPDAVEVGGGLVGGGRLAWPRDTVEDARPDWLVFGAVIRLVSMTPREAALHRLSTALRDEGFGEIGAERFIEGFARRLMARLDRWCDGDFASLARDYLAKLTRERGTSVAINANGDLRIERPGVGEVRHDLQSALETPSWLDHRTGGLRWGVRPCCGSRSGALSSGGRRIRPGPTCSGGRWRFLPVCRIRLLGRRSHMTVTW